ncbi:MAG TPA: hypothetical protein PKC28_11580, partial [Bdellovibrionales bacterium]|nr:hypothetical protein [Bdellovibrionales bacterium]
HGDELVETLHALVVGRLLNERVGNYNRGDQKLGYVHQAMATYVNGRDWFFRAIGGLDDDDLNADASKPEGWRDGKTNYGLAIAGYDHVLKQLNRELPDQEIADAISALKSNYAVEVLSAGANAEDMAAVLRNRGDVHGNAKIARALEALTVTDVRATIRRYLSPDAPYMQLTLNGCADALAAEDSN